MMMLAALNPQMELTPMNSRRIRVSQKRQLTIPQKFFEHLHIGEEVECFMRNGELVLRPIRENKEQFADHILEDLIHQGLSGEDLLVEFRKIQAKVRPAIERIIKEADQAALKFQGAGEAKMHELFGDLED